MDVYICIFCGSPIIFRYPWHQIYHIPSGWHCWKSRKGESPSLGYFEFLTPKKERKKYMKRFKTIYRKNEGIDNLKPLVRFIKNLWGEKKSDVIHDVLSFLSERENDFANNLIRKIVISDDWDRFVRIRRKYPLPKK